MIRPGRRHFASQLESSVGRFSRSGHMPVPKCLITHARLDCHGSFKAATHRDLPAICPGCGGTIHGTGRSFEALPSGDLERWAKARALFAAGFRSFSHRSASAPPRPGRLSGVAAFARDNPTHPLRVAAPDSSSRPMPFAGAARHRHRTQ